MKAISWLHLFLTMLQLISIAVLWACIRDANLAARRRLVKTKQMILFTKCFCLVLEDRGANKK